MPNRLINGDYVTSRRRTVPQPQLKGALFSHLFKHTVAATFDWDNVDKLVIGVLPAYCTIQDAVLRSPSGATNVVDVGIMSGMHGDTDINRTVGDELFDGIAMDAAGKRTINFTDLHAIVPVEYDRSIGIIATAADIAAAATIELDVVFKYGPRD